MAENSNVHAELLKALLEQPELQKIVTSIVAKAATSPPAPLPAREEVNRGQNVAPGANEAPAQHGEQMQVAGAGAAAEGASSLAAGGAVPGPQAPPAAAASRPVDEVTVARNDIEFDKLRTDEQGFTYRRVRPPRIVSRILKSVLDETTRAKYAGLSSWERIDLVCTSSKHKEKPCTAMRTVDRRSDTHEILSVTTKNEHCQDHAPQKRKRADADVRAEAKKALAQRKTPAQVSKELEERARHEAGAGPLSANRTLSQVQLEKMANSERRKANPHASSEVLQNVLTRFGAQMISGVMWPQIRFIYMNEWQRNHAHSRATKVISLDCTFRCVIGEFLLTTVLCQAPPPHNRVWFPLAFCIHNSESEEEISALLHDIQNKVYMKPEAVLADFSQAIQNAIKKELPTATYYGDIFHFFYDNRKWLTRHGVEKEERNMIIRQLRNVVTSRTWDALASRSEEFKRKWRQRYGEYIEYFTRQWESRIEHWCLVSRPLEIPSGDQTQEAYHRRLKKYVLHGRLKVDLVNLLDMLHKEALHWQNIVDSPALLERLSREINLRASKRAEPLRDALARSAVKYDSVLQLVADSDDNDGEESAAEDFALPDDQPLREELTPATSEVAANAAAMLRLFGACAGPAGAGCRAKKPSKMKSVSNQCTKKLCKTCCASVYGECRVSGHNTLRRATLLRTLIERLDLAASRLHTSPEKDVWISYKRADADAPRVHCVHDIRWEDDENTRFKARLFSNSANAEVDCEFKINRLFDVSWTQLPARPA